MSTVYICTQGTSIGAGCPHLKELWSAPGEWGMDHEKLSEEIRARLEKLRADKKLGDASAELSVLSRKKIAQGDRVVLLCTDGGLCRLCGEFTRKTIIDLFGLEEGAVRVVRVKDLQVQDAKRLEDFGLKNFIDEVRRAIEEYTGTYEVCLCPNGGYKGVVPFLAILGMLYHCSVYYTFEHAGTLIRLPPLPFSFDMKAYLRARAALAMIDHEVEVPEGKYLSAIENYQPDERDLFLGFVQQTRPGWVTVSSLVSPLVDGSCIQDAWLSTKALADLERERKGKDYYKWCNFILHSQDPAWRNKHFHTLEGSNYIGIKRTGESTARLLGFMRHGRFYIVRAVQHDEYERVMYEGRPDDYKDEDFQLWHPPAELEDVGGPLATNDDLRTCNELLKYENDELQRKLADTQADCNEKIRLKEENRARESNVYEARILELQNALEKAEADNCRLAEETKRLREETGLPWYRRLFK